MLSTIQHVSSTTGGWSLLIQSGILVTLLGGVFGAGRWAGTIKSDIHELRETLASFAGRIQPLERDYERRMGYAQAMAEIERAADTQKRV